MWDHKLSKNVCLENIRSIVQQIMMSQTNLAVLMYMVQFYKVGLQTKPRVLLSWA